MDLLQKVHVHRPISLSLHALLCAPAAQAAGFVGAYVEEGRRELRRDLGKPILDQRQRRRLSRRQHIPVRSLRRITIKFELEHVVQMPECFLFRHNQHVVLSGISDKIGGVSGRKRTARRRGQRMIGIKQRVLEIRRIDVGLE